MFCKQKLTGLIIFKISFFFKKKLSYSRFVDKVNNYLWAHFKRVKISSWYRKDRGNYYYYFVSFKKESLNVELVFYGFKDGRFVLSSDYKIDWGKGIGYVIRIAQGLVLVKLL